MLAAALSAAGERLESAEIAQVRYRPGWSVTASYRARLGDGSALLVAHAGAGIPDGAVLLDDGELQVGVWRYPNDPVLPGLHHAVDGELLPRLLRRLGVTARVAAVRRRAYRPTRRAVVEVTTDRGTLFLKVVRPGSAAALAAHHERIAAAVEAPRLVGAVLDLGVLVLNQVPGIPLRDLLRTGSPPALPAAGELLALLDRLPPLAGRAAGPLARAAGHAELLATVVPGLAGRVGALAAAPAPAPVGDAVSVHGDFHPGQVIVRDGVAAGLVDVDAAGTGERIDDLATMLGYLASAAADPEPPAGLARYGAALAAAFAGKSDPGELQRRVAAAIAGFATMPFVAQRPHWPELVRRRVDRAEVWLTGTGGTWV